MRSSGEPPNKGMKLTSALPRFARWHGRRSQLMPGVRRTRRDRVDRPRLTASWYRAVLIAVLVAHYGCVGACDVFSRTDKKLSGEYCLELEREFAHYRVQKCSGMRGANTDAIGLFEGTIQRIGWNDRYIVGWRSAAFGGDRSGWMVLDVSTGRIEGPFGDADFTNLRAQRTELRGISIREPQDVLR